MFVLDPTLFCQSGAWMELENALVQIADTKAWHLLKYCHMLAISIGTNEECCKLQEAAMFQGVALLKSCM